MYKRNQLKAKKDKQGIILISTLALGISLFAFMGLKTSKEEGINFCYRDTKRKNLFLLDLSDKLREDTWIHLVSELNTAIEQIPEGEELEFYILNSSNIDLAVPINVSNNMKTICKPTKKYKNDILSEVFDTHKHKMNIFENSIRELIDQNFNNKHAGAATSPIYTRIKNILTQNHYNSNVAYIFSDFMEYNPKDGIDVYACKGIDSNIKLPKIDFVSLYKIPTKRTYNNCRNEFISNLFHENKKHKKMKEIELTGEENNFLANSEEKLSKLKI